MHENREISGTSRSQQDRDRLAKAQSHNANMHAPEKSDCAVVPINQPNNWDQSSAEVGEGRARTKENIVQSNTSPTQSGERVSRGLSGGWSARNSINAPARQRDTVEPSRPSWGRVDETSP
jgi:hypothetical protein